MNWAYTQVRRGAYLTKAFRSPAAQAKLGKVLGSDKAGAFTDALAAEKAILRAERSIASGAGSPTQPLQQAAREADGDQTFMGTLRADTIHVLATHPLNPRAGISHVIGKQLMRGAAVAKAPTDHAHWCARRGRANAADDEAG